MVEHEEISAEDEQRTEGERAGEDVQRAEVIHRGRPDHHECADDERAFHIREGEPQIRLQTLLRALMKLRDFEFLASESVHHADRAQSFLRLGEDRAFLFLDRGRFRPNAIGEEVDRAHDERNDA